MIESIIIEYECYHTDNTASEPTEWTSFSGEKSK